MKNVPILQFLSIFCDFWLYFASDAKIKVYKRNLWSRSFFGMKVHYIRSVYSKYPFEFPSKSIFEIFFSTANIICMIITDIPLKKRNFWKNAPRGLIFSSNHPLHAQMIWWKNQQNPPTKSKVTFFLTANFWPFFVFFKKFSLIFSIGKIITSIFCIFLFRIEFYTKN